ncbi:hypothetical protein DCAR_0314091 [Daucus carota subsp. sativus]|uniref:Uncharacterized protein n=1 Tax=Daucus carota subsp. sativus TaxID=79200 RepID=A0A161WY87_DAUCS|nr:hypothetical protein DCAR_0314091 [Daucus carota subsp. sativus]
MHRLNKIVYSSICHPTEVNFYSYDQLDKFYFVELFEDDFHVPKSSTGMVGGRVPVPDPTDIMSGVQEKDGTSGRPDLARHSYMLPNTPLLSLLSSTSLNPFKL